MKKIILIVVLYICTGLLYSANLGEMIDQVRYQCQDASGDTDLERWSDEWLKFRFNEAQTLVIRKTNCLQATTSYTTYISTKSYSLPSDFLAPIRVCMLWSTSTSAGNVYTRLDRYTLSGLDERNEFWLQEGNSTPDYYWIYKDEIGFVPPFSRSYARSDGIQIQYVVRPSTMTTLTDVPFNSVSYLYPYHDVLVLKVCEWCKSDDGLMNDANNYKVKFDRRIEEMNKELGTSVLIENEDYNPNFHQ